MTPPKPLRALSDLEAAAHSNLFKAITAHGQWKPQFAIGLDAMAHIVAAYCRTALSISRAGLAVPPSLAADLAEMRGQVRDIMANWWWIEPDADVPSLRSDGLDPDAARLCGLPEERHGNA